MADKIVTVHEGAVQLKTCSRCEESKPETSEHFTPRKRCRNGLSRWCKPCEAAYAREWRAQNPEKSSAAARLRYAKDPDKHKGHGRRYNKRHPERRLQIMRNYRVKKGEAFRLRNNLGAYLSATLRKAGMTKNRSSWEEILGYTADDLIRHVERQFTKGMTWGNYGKWHLDHITPVVSFSYESVNDPDFLACWSLANLRPMWALENISKGGKIVYLI